MSTKQLIRASGPVLVAAMAILSMAPGRSASFGDPLPGTTPDERSRFLAGLASFDNAESVSDGLGPIFNENACGVCHIVGAAGGGGTRLETRFGRTVNGQFDSMDYAGGSLMQDHGIGLFGGVNFVSEVVPAAATIVAKRRTTPLFGLGLVDNVPDSVLLELAAHQAGQSPATAGRANVVVDPASGQQRVGRFGWKCQEATLFSFSGDAYLNEMGVTTPMFPIENCPQGNCALLTVPGLPAVPNDADNSTLVRFTDFMSFLGAPPPGRITTDVRSGARVFQQIGCADCHQPVLETGSNLSAALNRVTFAPFSDFLLHDMGSLGDGIAQNGAGPREMRTAPLWGLRIITSFLHDGRAANVTDAILAHDGQGRRARSRFTSLERRQRAALIAFLNSL